MAQERKTALVTGASSGLGVEFARQFAERGYDLVLTARSAEPMEKLADELRRARSVDVKVVPLDLAQPTGPAELAAQLDELGARADILVNNAGFGLSGRFLDHDPVRLQQMLALNIVSLTEMTRIFGRQMADRGGGRILLVASLVAYMPYPTMAVYAASKAYVRSLGEALNVELAPKVSVTVLSPGPVETGFAAAADFKIPESLRSSMLSPPEVAKIGVEALLRGESSIVAGRLNTVMAFASRFAPRRFLAKQMLAMS